ncbi:MAG: hypothetical protein WDM94_08555 [Bauldia sp.]
MAFLAVACGVISSAAHADNTVSGYLEVAGSAAWTQPVQPVLQSNPWTGADIAGRATFWLGPKWSTQADLSTESIWAKRNNSDGWVDLPATTGAIHLSLRNPSRGLIGGFGGVIDSGAGDAASHAQGVFGGIEGQIYLRNVTLYGQATYLKQSGGLLYDRYPYQLWLMQATARWFAAPNTKLEATVGYMGGGVWGLDYNWQSHAFMFSAEAEHRFDGAPVSAFVRAKGFADTDIGGFSTATNGTIQAGIRIRWGGGTLLDDDRNGTTLTLPDFTPLDWERSISE